MKATRTCSVEGCERKIAARNWCILHYKRWWRTGNPDVTDTILHPRGICSVEGCDRPHNAHGFCDLHYRRWRRDGEPGQAKPRFGTDHHNWKGDEAGYQAVHHRIWDTRGIATDHLCQHCCEPAAEWAYDHNDPMAKHDDHGRPYSLDAAHYLPLCKSCHQRFDNAKRGVA